MRILIDLQGAQTVSRFRGIGRYSLSLAMAMARNSANHDVWLMLNDAFPESIMSIRQAFAGVVPQEKIRIFRSPSHVSEIDNSNFWRTKCSEIVREDFVKRLKPDFVHVASLFEGYNDNAVVSIGLHESNLLTAVTLYDLIPLLNQSDYLTSNSHRNYYFRKLDSLKKANLLFAISEASRQEAISELNIDPNIVVNISAASDHIFKPSTNNEFSELRALFKIKRNMVMYAPGGFDKRKNFENLINAYASMPNSLRCKHQLVIVGDVDPERKSYLMRLASEAKLAEDELILTGYLKDHELVAFYNFATLFIFPSMHEGFGLPVLEAMACGAPVIGSKDTSISEIINYPEALFDPHSCADMANKISYALSNELFREQLSIHGLKQAELFSWQKSAKLALQSMERIYEQNRSGSYYSTNSIKHPDIFESIAKLKFDEFPKFNDFLDLAECVSFNNSNAEYKQFLLDISVIVHGDAKSGIQRVVRALLTQLFSILPDGYRAKAIYFDGFQYKYANSFICEINNSDNALIEDHVVDFFQDDIYLALDLNAHLTASVHDMHLRLQVRGVKLYFIVYDLLLIQHPEWWMAGTSDIFEAWVRSISEVATGLICISRSVADEVMNWLLLHKPPRSSPLNIGWFHLGADIEKSMPSKGFPSNADSVINALKSRVSFLMVGTVEPRKGHAQCIAAFEYLWANSQDINLVIVGRRGWLVDSLVEMIIEHRELNNRLFWLEGISDEFLDEIYKASSCLIAASEGEGFGLPLIEAAINKLPIIARDLPVFREVAGDHALYFSGFKPVDLAEVITKWIISHSNNSVSSSENIKYLSWNQSAANLLSVILDGFWYKTWAINNTLFFYGSDPRFGTNVGKRVERSMVTTGKVGYLIFGPYLTLDSGFYTVEIFGFYDSIISNLQLADFDVCSKAGEVIFSDGEIFSAQPGVNNFFVSFDFYLDDSYNDVEFRIRVSEKSNISIKSIGLHKNSENFSDGKSQSNDDLSMNNQMFSEHSMSLLRNGFLKSKDSDLSKRLALSFIVKDEALVVLDMLTSIYNAVGFVSFVDTGSSDSSLDIIIDFLTNKSIPFSYKRIIYSDFSFAQARNDSISMVPDTFEWIIVLDCDEIMLSSDISSLSSIINLTEFDCFEIPRYNWKNVSAERKTIDYPDFQQRLFRNNGKIKYVGKVHETLSNYLSKGSVGHMGNSVPHIHHTKLLFHFKYKEIRNRNVFYNSLLS